MEALKREATHKTPRVFFDPTSGNFEIGGRSIPEDTFAFYNDILQWVEDYGKSPAGETHVKFEFEYFNTSSSKNILELLKKLENIHTAGNKVKISWYYDEDDEDMMETGTDYQALLSVPLELITKIH